MQTIELARVHSEENPKPIFYMHYLRITEPFNRSLYCKYVSIKTSQFTGKNEPLWRELAEAANRKSGPFDVESLCYTHETNVILYVNYSFFKVWKEK